MQRNRCQATVTGGAMSQKTQHKRRQGWLLTQGSCLGIGHATALSVSCAIALWSRIAQAQPSNIVPDNTLGIESSVVKPNVDINNIKSEQISGGASRGSNLFHSFQEFNIKDGRGAYFNNPNGIENIFSRVTGGNASSILGKLGVLGNANLFLINPSGIIFGKNASLDVKGSFVASTASSFKFTDGKFSAISQQTTPLLTVSVPIGLQFAPSAKDVQVQGSVLRVSDGQTLALLGGNISLDNASLEAPGGRVDLGGLAGSGTVGLLLNGNNLSLSFPLDIQRTDASLTNAANVDVTGTGRGSVAVTARNINILGESRISSGIKSFAADGSQVGDITLNATGVVNINQLSRITNVVNTDAKRNAGNINIQAGEISITNLSSLPALDSSSSGQGHGGNVSLEANGSISLIGQSVKNTDKVISSRSAGGNAGNISLKATGSISLSNAYLDAISRSSTGNAGNILLQGNESVSLANNSSLVTATYAEGNSGNIAVRSLGPISFENSLVATSFGPPGTTSQPGNAGNIEITGRSVSVTGGAELTAISYKGANAGNIQLIATEGVEISGKARFEQPPPNSRLRGITPPNVTPTQVPPTYNSVLRTTSEEGATGQAGNINIITNGSLRILDGGRLLANAKSTGNAGNININAGDISITNLASLAALDSSNSGQGRGGNVSLEANGFISLIGQSVVDTDKVISSRSFPSALDAGNISLKANGSISLSNAYLDAISRSRTGNAGDILLQGNKSVSLANNSSLVAATYAQGNAGNVTVQSQGSVSLQTSMISTNIGTKEDSNFPLKEGKSGNVYISGRSVSFVDGALVTNRPFKGEPGNIEVNAQDFVELRGRSPFPPPDGYRLQNLVYSSLTTSGEERASSSSGDISITTGILRLSDGANIRADSRSTFKGGNITINAKVVELIGGGQLFTTTSGSGDAGNITFNVTERINISGSNPTFFDTRYTSDGTEFSLGPIDKASGIFANTSKTSTGQGGNLKITTPALVIQNGAQVSASTLGTGSGGTLTVNAPQFVTVTNNDSKLSVESDALGNAGSLTITTRKLLLTDKAQITVSAPRAQAGKLEIKASDIRLEQGELTAVNGVSSIEDENIALRDFDLLLMLDNSKISAQALNSATGGNIRINSPEGFIVTDKRENNDIVANAAQGRGGRIEIETTGIYGFEKYDRNRGDKYFSNISDINASSEAGSQFDGTIDINTLDTDPNRGLINLPAVPVDTQVAQGCTAGGSQAQSKFVITGRGGLPDNPGEALSTDAVQVDLVTLKPEADKPSTNAATTLTNPIPTRIVEATGWVRGADGNVVLTANPTTATPHSSWQKIADCRVLNQRQE